MYNDYYINKTILVTGGAGAIGSNLVNELSKIGAKRIIVFDNLSSSFIWNIPNSHNVLFINGDLRSEDDLRRAFHYKPTIVFHLAAFFANQNSIDYPILCEEVNSKGTLKLLEYCVLVNNIEKFVYTNSEGGAYGTGCEMPYVENKISLSLSSPYYVSKMSAESYCYYYQNQYSLPVCILRLFNSYGPGEAPGQYRNVIPNFIYWALQNKKLPLTGDSNISRDFVYVDDTVEAILRAGFIQEAIGEAINVASGFETKIYALAEMINEQTGNKSGFEILGQRKWDTRKTILGDNTKCEKILKFKPKPRVETGIVKTIAWFKSNWKNIEHSTGFMPGINPSLGK